MSKQIQAAKTKAQPFFGKLNAIALGSDEDSSNGNGLIINEKLAEDLRLLEAQAMETGFENCPKKYGQI